MFKIIFPPDEFENYSNCLKNNEMNHRTFKDVKFILKATVTYAQLTISNSCRG